LFACIWFFLVDFEVSVEIYLTLIFVVFRDIYKEAF